MITINADKKQINVGSASFFNCFYSTIYEHVKKAEVPNALSLLKKRELGWPDAIKTAREFNVIRDILSTFSPSEVIWDMDNPDESPPWGKNISPIITSLGNYFVSADGHDLISEIILLLQYANDEKVDISISN